MIVTELLDEADEALVLDAMELLQHLTLTKECHVR